MWTVRLGKPGGGEKIVTIEASNETKMKETVISQYPGHQIRNYSRN